MKKIAAILLPLVAAGLRPVGGRGAGDGGRRSGSGGAAADHRVRHRRSRRRGSGGHRSPSPTPSAGAGSAASSTPSTCAGNTTPGRTSSPSPDPARSSRSAPDGSASPGSPGAATATTSTSRTPAASPAGTPTSPGSTSGQGSPSRRGQRLGVEGSTGTSTGNHLHLEILVHGVATDPVPWMLAHGAPLNGHAVTATPAMAPAAGGGAATGERETRGTAAVTGG